MLNENRNRTLAVESAVARCLWIVYRAASPEGLRRRDYHERFGASPRSFFRDVHRVARAGFAIVAERRMIGGSRGSAASVYRVDYLGDKPMPVVAVAELA